MAANSKIEWTTHTFNPWRGCTKVSAGCANCYAETLSGRNPKTLGVWGPQGTRVVASESMWREPVKWDRAAKAAGERHRVFCASLADVFEGPQTMPESAWAAIDAARVRLFDLILATPNLDWLILTKRPKVAREWLSGKGYSEAFPHAKIWPFNNVWLGVSVEDQKAAKERIPILLDTPAKVRFLSVEPLLGPLDIADYLHLFHGHPPKRWPCGSRVDWVIVGGESGPGARPMHPNWVRSLRDQCQAAGVPFFFKQWGEWWPYFAWDDDMAATYEDVVGNISTSDHGEFPPGFDCGDPKHEEHRWPKEFPNSDDMQSSFRVGKRAAGRLLDGREWNEFPTVEVAS